MRLLSSVLRNHRKLIVRRVARHTLLAYGYLRGRDCIDIEQRTASEADWQRVWDMVERYGFTYDESTTRRRDFNHWTCGIKKPL